MVTIGKIAARSVDHMFSLCFDYLLFKLFLVLVLRAGFGFWLLHFLIFAYVLLLFIRNLHVSTIQYGCVVQRKIVGMRYRVSGRTEKGLINILRAGCPYTKCIRVAHTFMCQ